MESPLTMTPTKKIHSEDFYSRMVKRVDVPTRDYSYPVFRRMRFVKTEEDGTQIRSRCGRAIFGLDGGKQNITDIRKRWQRRKELRARRRLKQPAFTLDDL